MIVEIDRSAGVVTKRASTAEEAVRLRREAKVLETVRHPGVTELLGVDDGPGQPLTLRLRAVSGRPLADLAGIAGGLSLGFGEVAGLGVVLATTLADLHDLGMAHGTVSADHILVDDATGHPVLCSLGRAHLPDDAAGATPADDVTALAVTLLACLPADPGGQALLRILTRAARPSRWAPTARHMAARLAQIPQAGLPTVPKVDQVESSPGAEASETAVGASAARRDATAAGRRWVAVGLVGCGLAAVAVAALLTRPPPHGNGPVTSNGALRCPVVDLGCRPLPRTAGMVTTGNGRYLIGAAADPVVVGRWRCGGPLPALLQLTTGTVWAFDEWPVAGSRLPGRLIAHLDGASSLTVDPKPDGCDRLLVIRRTDPALPVDPSK